MTPPKVLILGASGAMGKYLVPILAEKGFSVDAVALDDAFVTHKNINWIKTNSKDADFRKEIFARNYDGIVDFMIYPTSELVTCLPPIVNSTGHYIYLSTYRIYDGTEIPINENSPRLIDNSKDTLLVNSDDYSIYKARGENILHSCQKKNWSIIRPAVTYSFMRNQLVTLETPCTVGRAMLGKTVFLPETAKDIQATMSWAGDVAQMISGILFNDKALGETYTVATSEHHTWGEIAEYYKDICNLKCIWGDQDDFIKCVSQTYNGYPDAAAWQLIYDRLFHRVIDNSKILALTGMKQENMMKLYDGLKYEISRLPEDYGRGAADNWINQRMDDLLKQRGCR